MEGYIKESVLRIGGAFLSHTHHRVSNVLGVFGWDFHRRWVRRNVYNLIIGNVFFQNQNSF